MIYYIRYGIAQTVYFPLITAGGTAFQVTWAPAAGESRYIADGAAAANLGSNPVHEDDGIWSQALTVAETSFDTIVLTYSDGTTDIEDQAIILSTALSGQIEANQGIFILEVDTATFTATSTDFECFSIAPTATEETTADHFKDRNVLFTTGALTGSMKSITTTVLANSKVKITCPAFTEAPADGDRLVIL